jgi:prevent-host-death family protein
MIANIKEARANLSKLIRRAGQGEEVIIARRNRPVAMLVPRLPKGGNPKPSCKITTSVSSSCSCFPC